MRALAVYSHQILEVKYLLPTDNGCIFFATSLRGSSAKCLDYRVFAAMFMAP